MRDFNSDKINVGDKVVVHTYSWSTTSMKIAEVTKKTPSGMVDVDGKRWMKNGRPYGHHRGYIEFLTPEIEEKIRREQHEYAVHSKIRNVKWNDVSIDKLERILAILDENTSSTDSD